MSELLVTIYLYIVLRPLYTVHVWFSPNSINRCQKDRRSCINDNKLLFILIFTTFLDTV